MTDVAPAPAPEPTSTEPAPTTHSQHPAMDAFRIDAHHADTEHRAEPAHATTETPAASTPEPINLQALKTNSASIQRVVQAWINQHIAGGPIARNTEAWNALQAAVPALQQALLKGD